MASPRRLLSGPWRASHRVRASHGCCVSQALKGSQPPAPRVDSGLKGAYCRTGRVGQGSGRGWHKASAGVRGTSHVYVRLATCGCRQRGADMRAGAVRALRSGFALRLPGAIFTAANQHAVSRPRNSLPVVDGALGCDTSGRASPVACCPSPLRPTAPQAA